MFQTYVNSLSILRTTNTINLAMTHKNFITNGCTLFFTLFIIFSLPFLFKALGRCYGFCAGRNLYRAVPKAKRGHSNHGRIWRVVVLWPLTAGQGNYGSILTQIPTGYLRKSNYTYSNVYFTIILSSFTFQNNTVELITFASLQN